MGTKYSSQTQSGYNTSPPPDDGSTGSNNLITWANTKTKIGDPLLTLAQNINTALVNALDFGSRTTAINDTAGASDHMKTIEVTAAATMSLPTAATIGSGFIVSYVNTSGSSITINLVTATDTLNGTVNGTVSLPTGYGVVLKTNTAHTGYYITSNFVPTIPSTTTGGDSLTSVGRFIKYTQITATNATWSPQAATKNMIVMCAGAGGGGDAQAGSAASGGKKGLTSWAASTSVSGTYAATIGAGGAGTRYDDVVPAQQGGTTSFIGTGISVSAAGGAPGNRTYVGDPTGESYFGAGGAPNTNTPGNSAAANSAAGGGSSTTRASGYAGSGGSGVIFVWEFA